MITLSHIEGTPFYQDETVTTDPGLLAFYVAAQGIDPQTLPPALTVAEAWAATGELKGYFLFLKERPDWAVFGPIFQAQSGLPDPQHTGFAWVTYSNQTEELGPIYRLDALQKQENVLIAAGVTLRFKNYGLPFEQGGLIKAGGEGAQDINSFTFEYPLGEDWPRPEGAGINLPLTGSRRFSLSSLGLVGDFSDDVEQGWDVACRFYAQTDGRKIIEQRYPIFQFPFGGYQLLFEMNWDPLDQLNHERTWLAFGGAAYRLVAGENGEPSAIEPLPDGGFIPSWFRTIYGEPISLRPVTDSDNPARLVFETRPDSGGRDSLYYLVPKGEFECFAEVLPAGARPATGVEPNPPFQLLCGLAGTESVGFYSRADAAKGSVLTFHPKQPAFAPVFPLFQKEGRSPGSLRRRGDLAKAPLLDSDWTTSWVSFGPNVAAPGQVPVYYAQPEDASLFREKAGADEGGFVLENFRAPAAVLDASAGSACYPLVPYSGLSLGAGDDAFSVEDVRDFEHQIINPTRRQKVGGPIPGRRASAAAASEAEVTTTTPQGLVATIQGLEWLSVLLAENEEDGSRLEFTTLPDELRGALQSNQLFLVASLKEPLGAFSNRINIAGWPFHLDVGQAAGDFDYRNVLIFKFGTGTLKERAADPKSWTEAEFFNENPQALSLWLGSYIEQAEVSDDDDARLRNFVDLVNTPSWNGVLALKVSVGLEQFPEDLKGLLGGVDLSRFNAHHFGIQVNFVTADDGLRQRKSSLFALINYVDKDYTTKQNFRSYHGGERALSQFSPPPEAPAAPRDETTDFKVLTLQVVFENSDIKDFASKIQLTTTHWFGEPARLAPGFPPNPLEAHTIEFDGSYENHNGQRTYSFTTLKDLSYKFLLTSHVLNYVEVLKAQFNTLRSATEGGAQDSVLKVFTRFSFWGYVNFKELEVLDIFSFGDLAAEAPTDRRGLNFANVGIRMDFSLSGGKTSERVFAFDPGEAGFDTSVSTARPDSLFSRFPISNPALLQGAAGETTADRGYLPVRTPTGFEAKPLDKRWFGLAFDLNLGTMGALAEKAGFTAGILAAWSPDPAGARAALQIRLPGSGSGKKTLSLQSVLKLSAQYFEMSAEGGPEGRNYRLLFRNIGLSLLGQKLPPNGNTDIVLFGHSGAAAGAPKSLGWFAAFYKEKPKPRLKD